MEDMLMKIYLPAHIRRKGNILRKSSGKGKGSMLNVLLTGSAVY
jgi:hypothetical protein